MDVTIDVKESNNKPPIFRIVSLIITFSFLPGFRIRRDLFHTNPDPAFLSLSFHFTVIPFPLISLLFHFLSIHCSSLSFHFPVLPLPLLSLRVPPLSFPCHSNPSHFTTVPFLVFPTPPSSPDRIKFKSYKVSPAADRQLVQ